MSKKKLPKGWEYCHVCKDYHLEIEDFSLWVHHHLDERYWDEFIKRLCEERARTHEHCK